jgi:tRNA(fMet)-specific endonuclease VapC
MGMSYLIDSDVTIDHLAHEPEVASLLHELAGDGLAMSVITYMEVLQGCMRAPDPDAARSRFEELVLAIPVLPISTGIAEECAILRERFRTQGRRVGSRALDLLIASTALHYGLTLITLNIRDYADIPDLSLHSRS